MIFEAAVLCIVLYLLTSILLDVFKRLWCVECERIMPGRYIVKGVYIVMITLSLVNVIFLTLLDFGIYLI